MKKIIVLIILVLVAIGSSTNIYAIGDGTCSVATQGLIVPMCGGGAQEYERVTDYNIVSTGNYTPSFPKIYPVLNGSYRLKVEIQGLDTGMNHMYFGIVEMDGNNILTDSLTTISFIGSTSFTILTSDYFTLSPTKTYAYVTWTESGIMTPTSVSFMIIE